MKTYTILILWCFISSVVNAQVGIGNTSPRGALDINKANGTNTQGLVLPTNADVNHIVNPQNAAAPAVGTIIYDSVRDCIRVYKSTGWSNCLAEVATKEITIEGDTHTRGGNPTTNYATNELMLCKTELSSNPNPANVRYAFMWLDISDYRSTLQSVILHINVSTNNTTNGNSATFNLVDNRINNMVWQDTDITFNNQPATLSTIATITTAGLPDWKTIDITSVVNNAIVNGETRISLGITSDPNRLWRFATRDNTDPTIRPYCTVVE